MQKFLIYAHDACLDATGVSKEDDELLADFKEVPSEVKSLAAQWGWSDTEVREKLYYWYKKNKKQSKE